MCESYSRSLLRVSVAQICQALGWDSVQLSACHLLTDVLQRYLQQLGRGCHRYSELYGRTDPILDDVGEAFQLMGVNLHELEDYIHNIEPVTFPHQIPSFPVSKNNVLQFPQPGSKDAEERKDYIPDYLPPIVSSQEEEEEEQVPTDGGTSAEAMQVPLEEDDEMEDEEEVFNDENFLGKRPLDSPESEEMPTMKRPRLLSTKGDSLDVILLEAREPLSSINPQKIPPMLSPVHVQDSTDLAPPSPEPPMLAPFAKSQLPTAKPLETKSFTPKTKTKASSPGQKTKSPKTTLSPARLGSPIRSPKTIPKEKKSPGRSKSPKSPKSPKIITHVPQPPARPETPNRTPSTLVVEKTVKETIPVKPTQTPPETGKVNIEMLPKKAVVTDKTIDDSIDAVIARACAEREPDPFEFSSGSESEVDTFTSPKRISGSECTTPKTSAFSNNFTKAGSTPLPLSGGTSSSDNSWTMDASIDEVVRKAKLGTPSNMPPTFPYISSPSISPPTPEPLHKGYEEKAKLPSSVDVKKKLKKELKTKLKKKEKQRDREREKERNKERSKEREKMREREKEREAAKEVKYPWKELMKDEESDPYKFKIREFEDIDPKVRLKDGIVRKEKHKDKKKDRERGKRDREKREREKAKEKSREDKIKAPPTQLVLPPKEMALPLFSPSAAVRVPAMLPALSPVLPEKLFEEKEKHKEKERKKDKKEKKKKKEKEKEKEKKEREKEKREREKREREKEKHKHEKVKVESVIPAPSPVIPRLTLRVGAGQDKIVISKVVPAPEAKPAPSLNRPKTPPPAPVPVPVRVSPTPLPPPLLVQAAVCPALMPSPAPALSGVGSAKAPVRSVVTETVSAYVIRDESGNQIWICPGCNKPDDGSAMIGCDLCDDWYHWPCVGIMAAPPEEVQWFCPKCAKIKKDKKHKKRKHRAH